MFLLKKGSIDALVKLAQELANAGKKDEAIDLARIVLVQDIYMRQIDDTETPVPEDLLAVFESTLGDASLELVKVYIQDHDMDVADALIKLVDMCSDCGNAEIVKWIENDGKITTEEARNILKEKDDFGGTECDYCKEKDIEKGTRKKQPEEK